MSLEQFRNRGATVVAGVGIASALLVAGIEMGRGGPGPATALAAIALVALVTGFVWFRRLPAFRYLAVSVLMTQVMAALIAMRGSPFQIDVHMAFFASLAMCALLYDSKAILLGTALVAIHHLGLGLT